MNTLKTLALAALAATALGTGAAMAQSDGPSMRGSDFGAAYNLFEPTVQTPTVQTPAVRQSVVPNTAVQSGSSDPANPWAGSGASTDSPWYVGGGSGG
jgi:hypothetical protein